MIFRRKSSIQVGDFPSLMTLEGFFVGFTAVVQGEQNIPLPVIRWEWRTFAMRNLELMKTSKNHFLRNKGEVSRFKAASLNLILDKFIPTDLAKNQINYQILPDLSAILRVIWKTVAR